MKKTKIRLKKFNLNKKNFLLLLTTIIIFIVIVVTSIIPKYIINNQPTFEDNEELEKNIVESSITYLEKCLKNDDCEYNIRTSGDFGGKPIEQYEELTNIKIEDLIVSGDLRVARKQVIDFNGNNIGKCTITATKITNFKNNREVIYIITSSISSYKKNNKIIECPVPAGEEYKILDGDKNG